MLINMRAVSAAAALALAGCTVSEGETGNQATAPTAETADAAGGVARDEVAAPQPAVAPMAAQTVIQSQPGPDGSQVDLLKLAVTGDILTATFRCSSQDKSNTEGFNVEGISVIDDATAQRISVLKDNAGDWLASRVSGTTMMADCEVQPGIFWAKFPAPPASSPTVSINLPGTAPFDGIPVTR